MFEPMVYPRYTKPEPQLLTPEARDLILDRHIQRMTELNYYLLTRIDHTAILACEQSIGIVKVFIDEFGEVRHD